MLNSAPENLDGLCQDLTLGLKVSLQLVKGAHKRVATENPKHLDCLRPDLTLGVQVHLPLVKGAHKCAVAYFPHETKRR